MTSAKLNLRLFRIVLIVLVKVKREEIEKYFNNICLLPNSE